MAKPAGVHSKPSFLARDGFLRLAAVCAVSIFCTIWIYTDPLPSFSTLFSKPNADDCGRGGQETLNVTREYEEKTFYDDPKVGYTVDKTLARWDEKRREWLKSHVKATLGTGVDKNRVLVVTGSQPSPCKNRVGDHLLLRSFKNKVDYCRIQGCEIFYNNAILNPKMKSYWAKIPVIRAAMVAHPEAEWIFWVDSDAIFTDMEFQIPWERYEAHNLVVHGWPNLIYEKKSWVAVNAGVFLIRNCQWSVEFLEKWATMGPSSPDYAEWGKILRKTLSDKLFPEPDDQSALVYLLLKEKQKWGDKIYVENEYSLHGYWRGAVHKFEEVDEKYMKVEKGLPELRRRHAEAATRSYGAARGKHLPEGWRRPFVTHFTGCQPCSGDHNPEYVGDSCWVEMERGLNFADNQVLRNYGFHHRKLDDGSSVSPLPFDFPVEESYEPLV